MAHASFLSERLHADTLLRGSKLIVPAPARPQHRPSAPDRSPCRSRGVPVARREASSTLVRRPNSWVSALPSLLPLRDVPTPHIESVMSVEPEPRRRAGAQRPTPKRRRANQTRRPTAKRIRLRRHKLLNRQNATSRVACRGTRCAVPQLGALPQLPEEELSLSPSRSRGLGAENVRDASARG